MLMNYISDDQIMLDSKHTMQYNTIQLGLRDKLNISPTTIQIVKQLHFPIQSFSIQVGLRVLWDCGETIFSNTRIVYITAINGNQTVGHLQVMNAQSCI